jgi:hypothetical protein
MSLNQNVGSMEQRNYRIQLNLGNGSFLSQKMGHCNFLREECMNLATIILVSFVVEVCKPHSMEEEVRIR